MRSGNLRDRLTVERQSQVADEYGNTSQGWSAIGTFWADIRVTPGKERVASGALEATATATVRLRVSTDAKGITAADRMTFRGLVWNIRNEPVVMGNRGEFIEFIAQAGGAV